MKSRKNLSFDGGLSKRRIDDNGFMHVESSHISKEAVNGYWGHEIPFWQDLGLESDKIYYGFRPGEELARAAGTFNGLPLLLDHYEESADNPQTDHRIGSVGTNARYVPPYLDNALSITDRRGIEAVESGECREISCSYAYEPEMRPGVFGGQKYDFIMRNIRGNHVALVREGRAGSDVAVADSQIKPTEPATPTEDYMDDKFWKSLYVKLNNKFGKGGKTARDNSPEEPVGDNEEPQADADPVAEALALLDTWDNPDAVGKLKALINSLAAPPAADEDPVAEEPKEGPPAPVAPEQEKIEPPADEGTTEDEDPAQDEEPGVAKEEEKPSGAADSLTIRKIRKTLGEQTEAARLVEPILGRVDGLAFDGAAVIYRKALERCGIKTSTQDAHALRDMVRLELRHRASRAASVGTARDNSPDASAVPVHKKFLDRFRVINN